MIIYTEQYCSKVAYKYFDVQDVEFKEFSRRPDAYQKVCGLIAPSIFGHDDVKKAVACLLFGGARKVRIFCTFTSAWSR